MTRYATRTKGARRSRTQRRNWHAFFNSQPGKLKML
jgi:hypothetical protein